MKPTLQSSLTQAIIKSDFSLTCFIVLTNIFEKTFFAFEKMLIKLMKRAQRNKLVTVHW